MTLHVCRQGCRWQATRLCDGGGEPTAAIALLNAAQVGDVLVLPLHSDSGRDAAAAHLLAGAAAAR